jgi:hypothetical protein
MKKIVNYLMIVFCLGILIACTKDFIQKDIKNDTINIIAPADNLNTPSNLVTFWWEELEGAEKYDIQIVKPSFDSILQLIVDTTVTVDKFTHSFTPGKYQWRIRATNGGGSTQYVTRTLFIDTTSNLNLLTVSLISPIVNYVTASNSISFSWNPLSAATYYQLTITNGTGSITTVPSLTVTSYNYTFTTNAGTEEKIKWQVKAFNTFNNTVNDEIRSFRIDHKLPSAPTLSAPGNSLTVKDSSSFRWTYGSVKTDIFLDSIYISTDSVFTNISHQLPITRIGNIGNVFSIKPTLSSPTNTLIASPYYWWKVKSVDSLGNVSPASSSYRFKLMN